MGKFMIGLALGLSSLVAMANPAVVIVGGGAAGLEAAEILRSAGISYVLLESAPKGGGRVSSRPATGDLDLVLDEGANLINSTDLVTLSRLKRFGIPFVRRFPEDADAMNYMIDGRTYTQKQADELLFATNSRAFWKMAVDQNSPREEYFTATSVENYLKEVGADETLTRLIDSFFWSEYGRRNHELNVHVLFDYFAIDIDKKNFQFIPNYDEAFTIPGGTGQLTEKLMELNRRAILYEHTATKIERLQDTRTRVIARTPEGSREFIADFVLFAAPLHALNFIEVDLPEVTPSILNEARQVTYARGVKLHLKFAKGFRDLYKFRGIFMTDTGEQIWTSMQGQPGDAGLLTVLTGPLPQDEQDARIARILGQLEKFAPGVRRLYIGAERSDAPFSYSGAMRPGEAKDLRINKLPGERFIPIGEASGGLFQGYLEGAFRSARLRTTRLVERLKSTAARCELRVI